MDASDKEGTEKKETESGEVGSGLRADTEKRELVSKGEKNNKPDESGQKNESSASAQLALVPYEPTTRGAMAAEAKSGTEVATTDNHGPTDLGRCSRHLIDSGSASKPEPWVSVRRKETSREILSGENQVPDREKRDSLSEERSKSQKDAPNQKSSDEELMASLSPTATALHQFPEAKRSASDSQVRFGPLAPREDDPNHHPPRLTLFSLRGAGERTTTTTTGVRQTVSSPAATDPPGVSPGTSASPTRFSLRVGLLPGLGPIILLSTRVPDLTPEEESSNNTESPEIPAETAPKIEDSDDDDEIVNDWNFDSSNNNTKSPVTPETTPMIEDSDDDEIIDWNFDSSSSSDTELDYEHVASKENVPQGCPVHRGYSPCTNECVRSPLGVSSQANYQNHPWYINRRIQATRNKTADVHSGTNYQNNPFHAESQTGRQSHTFSGGQSVSGSSSIFPANRTFWNRTGFSGHRQTNDVIVRVPSAAQGIAADMNESPSHLGNQQGEKGNTKTESRTPTNIVKNQNAEVDKTSRYETNEEQKTFGRNSNQHPRPLNTDVRLHDHVNTSTLRGESYVPWFRRWNTPVDASMHSRNPFHRVLETRDAQTQTEVETRDSQTQTDIIPERVASLHATIRGPTRFPPPGQRLHSEPSNPSSKGFPPKPLAIKETVTYKYTPVWNPSTNPHSRSTVSGSGRFEPYPARVARRDLTVQPTLGLQGREGNASTLGVGKLQESQTQRAPLSSSGHFVQALRSPGSGSESGPAPKRHIAGSSTPVPVRRESTTQVGPNKDGTKPSEDSKPAE